MSDTAEILTIVYCRIQEVGRAASILIGCGAALVALSTCQVPRAEECFDFRSFSYADESAARGAFDACYPIGTNLEAALNSDAGGYSIDFAHALGAILGANLSDIQGNPNESVLTMQWRKPLSDTVVNYWILVVHLDSRYEIHDSEILQFFQDSDHRARGLPLDFRVLPWGRVRSAVEQHLPPDANSDSVARLLEDAGAIHVDTEEGAGGGKKTVHCFNSSKRLRLYKLGDFSVWKVTSEFDAQGDLIDYEVLLEPWLRKYRECDRVR